MAHFYGTVRGMSGLASRLGSKYSGLRTSANGWGIGVDVQLIEENGEDTCIVWLTSGSGGVRKQKYIGSFTAADLTSDPADV